MPWDGSELLGRRPRRARPTLGGPAASSPAGRRRSRSGTRSGPRAATSSSSPIAADWWNLERVSGGDRQRLHRGRGRVRLAPVGVRARTRIAFLTTAGSSACTTTTRTRHRRARSRHRRAHRSRPALRRAPRRARHRRRPAPRSCSSPAPRPARATWCGSTSRPARSMRSGPRRGPGGQRLLSVPRAIEFPTEGGLRRTRSSTRRRTRTSTGPRRAAAADRDEPRRSDVGNTAPRSICSAVLDEPRVRRRRRRTTAVARATGVPTGAAERQVGRRRPAGLRQRRPVPGRPGRRRRRAAADPRRQRRRLHDALRADVHRRVRGGRELLRRSPTSSRSPRAGRTSSSRRYEHTMIGP